MRRMRTASQIYPRSLARAPTGASSAPLVSRRKYYNARYIPWVPGPSKCLYFRRGARFTRLRPMGSTATSTARDPGPYDWAAINDSEVLPDSEYISQPGRVGRTEMAFYPHLSGVDLTRGRTTDVHNMSADGKDVLSNGHGVAAVFIVLREGFTEFRGRHGGTRAAFEGRRQLRIPRGQRWSRPPCPRTSLRGPWEIRSDPRIPGILTDSRRMCLPLLRKTYTQWTSVLHQSFDPPNCDKSDRVDSNERKTRTERGRTCPHPATRSAQEERTPR